MVVGAVLVLAITLARLADRLPWPRIARGAAALVLLGLGPLAVARMAQFLVAYDDMHQLRGALAQVAGDASAARPVSVVTVNRALHDIPFLNCNAVFPLLERPVAARDTPMVSLGFVFQPVPASEHLLFDVGPWRALWEMGSTMFEWHRVQVDIPAHTSITRRTATPPAPLPELRDLGRGRFAAAAPIDTFAVEAVEVEVEGACRGGRVEWLYFAPDGAPASFSSVVGVPEIFRAAPDHATLRGGTARGGNTVFYVDLQHHLTLLSLRLLGGLAGFEVFADGGARPVRVRMLPRAELLLLPRRIAGDSVVLEHAGEQLVAPPRPAGTRALTLYLIGPDTTLTLPVEPGPVNLPDATQRSIRIILRASRQDRYYFYFAADGDRAWRSAVDWLVFTSAGAR
jgi:hypothetical protein